MKKIYDVAIIGCGSRGCFTYGKLMMGLPEEFRIVSLCDIKPTAIARYKKEFNVADENCFLDENEFFAQKRADVLIVATQDKDHVRMAIKGLELGYHILLEKPISPLKSELMNLLATQKKTGGKVLVCHVLRYAPAYLKIKELLNSGAIGELVKIEAMEKVAYWHQSHSFVRGNWRVEEETSPMIMAKCCHDLDMLQYFVGSKCTDVYSTGGLTFFNEKHQPEGASDRCETCKYIHECPYSAEIQYVERFKEQNYKQGWPFNVVDPVHVPYDENQLRQAYQKNGYGRCVFKCDNNVVDHQQVEMTFENGVTASLTMTAFTALSGRRMDLHGTYGEIVFEESANSIKLYQYNGHSVDKYTEYIISDLVDELKNSEFGHGGGDYFMIHQFYDMLQGNVKPETSLENSIESHLIAIAAEDSRKQKKVIKVHE